MGCEVVPVIPVRDVDAAVAWFVDVLGFDEDFRWKEYAGVRLDGARAHLNGFSGSDDRIGKSQMYFFVPDVDAVWTRVVAAGGAVDHPIGDQEYGMRDFSVRDADGNRYTFGTETPPAADD